MCGSLITTCWHTCSILLFVVELLLCLRLIKFYQSCLIKGKTLGDIGFSTKSETDSVS